VGVTGVSSPLREAGFDHEGRFPVREVGTPASWLATTRPVPVVD